MTDMNLDIEELLHLAMHATETGQYEKAIDFLKSILARDPRHARAEYFLAAVYAELHMFDQAKARMQSAIDNGVELPSANFQLGLLYATSWEPDKAKQAWLPLQKLGPGNPLFLFQRGLTALLEDRFDDCITDLQEGIQRNALSEPLNDDMRRVIGTLQTRGHTAAARSAPEPATKDNVGERVLLAAYKRQSFDE